MRAELLVDERFVLAEDAFVEIVVWRLPRAARGSLYRFTTPQALLADFGRMSMIGDGEMTIVTLDVADRETVQRRALDAPRGHKQGARISFATPELLFRLLTAKRWELIRVMTGAGPMTIRETARRVGRDVKAVHGDVHALLNTGILRKNDDKLVEFPFDAIRVEVMLRAA